MGAFLCHFPTLFALFLIYEFRRVAEEISSCLGLTCLLFVRGTHISQTFDINPLVEFTFIFYNKFQKGKSFRNDHMKGEYYKMCILQLRQTRNQLHESAKAFLRNHRTKNGALTAEYVTIYETMEQEIEDLSQELSRLE